MVTAVPSLRRQARSRPLVGILGGGWAQRVRTAFVGLLGIVVALGLAMVGVMAHLGFPDFPLSPLPDPPAEGRTAVGAATIVPGAAASRSSARRGGDAGDGPSSARRDATATDRAATAPGGLDRVSAARAVAVPVSAPASPKADPPAAAKPPPDPGSGGAAPTRSPGEAAGAAGQTQGERGNEPAPAEPDPAPPHPGNGSGKGQAPSSHAPPAHAAASSAKDDGPGPANGHAFGNDESGGPPGKVK